jgi:hypothetical protein
VNESETLEFAGFLTARWPGRPRNSHWAKAWEADFEPFSFDACVSAARAWRSEGKVAPDGDDLLSILTAERDALPELLVGEIVTAVSRRGFYDMPSPEDWSNPIIPEAIRAFGGWVSLCQGTPDLRAPASHSQMRETLKGMLARQQREMAQISDPMRDVIESVRLKEIP